MTTRIGERDEITILHVIDTLQTGGTETQLLRTLPHLDARTFRQVLCPLIDQKAPTWLTEGGIETYALGVATKNDLLRGVARLQRVIRRLAPDLVHTHLFQATLIGRLAGRLARLPVVTTLVNTPYEPEWRQDDPALNRAKVEAVRRIDAATAFATNRFVAISEVVKRSAVRHLGLPAERIAVVHRGVDLEEIGPGLTREGKQIRRALGVGSEVLFLLNVGRLVPQKGQRYLIEAMAQVRPLVGEARLFIAGEGRLRSELEAQIQVLKLSDVAHLLGDRRDVPALLAAADIFVFPSLSEGFGVALLEAMAHGKPCIASNLEIVDEVAGREAVVPVPPRAVGALAAAIVALARDAGRRQALGEAARMRARSFDLKGAALRLEAVYREVMGRSVPAAALAGSGG